MLSRKKQRLDQEGFGDPSVYEGGSQDTSAPFANALPRQSTPEVSGALKTETTEVTVLLRRQKHLHNICQLYEAQLLQLASKLSSAEAKQRMHDAEGAAADQASDVSDIKDQQSVEGHSLSSSLPDISRWEQLSGAAYDRELDGKRAIAVLCGSRMRYLIKSSAVDLGRSTSSLGKVDLDLSQEGDARKISRQQAHLSLCPDGSFLFTNMGRRTVFVNGMQLVQHHSITLHHLSLLDLAGIHLLFVINHLAVHRLVVRSQNLVL